VSDDARALPEESEDRARWKEQTQRLAMQDGDWEPYLRGRLEQFFDGAILRRIKSGLDLGSNAFRFANERRSVLYDVPATSSFRASQEDRAALKLETYWAQSQRRHIVTNACGESLVRLDWSPTVASQTGSGILYKTIEPNVIVAEAAAGGAPNQPVYVEHLMERKFRNGEEAWVWEIWNLRDENRPIYEIRSADRRKDLTAEIVGDTGLPGNWPYWDAEGFPILPYAMHHLALNHRMWNWRPRKEIVQGTLNAGCLRTWFLAGLRDLVHPQRYAIGVRVPSSVRDQEKNPVDSVTLDASAILMFQAIGEGAQVGTLDPAMNAVEALDAIERYNAGLLEQDGLGIEPTNTSRMSGYAIVVTQSSLRRVQMQQTPSARIGDQQVLATAARMLNAYQGTSLPERPESYSISYHGVPLSLEELRARLEKVQILRSQRLMTRVDALLELYPNLTPEEAREKLAEIDAEGVPAEPAADVQTITDPSSGAPLRTPRGVSAPPPEGITATTDDD
jgi:hypothetical protein